MPGGAFQGCLVVSLPARCCCKSPFGLLGTAATAASYLLLRQLCSISRPLATLLRPSEPSLQQGQTHIMALRWLLLGLAICCCARAQTEQQCKPKHSSCHLHLLMTGKVHKLWPRMTSP